MTSAYLKAVWSVGLVGIGGAALAGEAKAAPPQEPVGFITGGVIGGLAAGPIGAVVGAGLGTWLGNRVHRAGDASKAEATVAVLQSDKSELQTEKSALLNDKNALTATNVSLSARLDDLTQKVQAAGNTKPDGSEVLDG